MTAKTIEAVVIPIMQNDRITHSPHDRSLTRKERKVVKEFLVQRMVIETQFVKTIYAEHVSSQLTLFTMSAGCSTFGYIEALQAQGHSQVVQSFAEKAKQLYGYHALEMLSSSLTLIHREVNRGLYPEDDKFPWW